MRRVIEFLALIGFTTFAHSFLMGLIRSRQDMHQRWITAKQAEMLKELYLYADKFGEEYVPPTERTQQ